MSRTYVALDIETTGLNPERDAITEIGAVKFQQGHVIGEWSSLINPFRPLPYKIQQLTGITQSDVDNAPPLRKVARSLQDFVRDLPIIGHNVSFDLAFLNNAGLFVGNPHIDTFELASILMPHASRYSLSMLSTELGIELDNAHRALADARATKDLFLALLEHAYQMDLRTVQDINRLAGKSNWQLKTVFRDIERSLSRNAFTGSIGQQLREKGLLDGAGSTMLFSSGEERRPLQRADTRQAIDVDELSAMVAEGGTLAQHFPNYEYRPQQVDMLQAVAKGFNEKTHYMIEAGTGTGKSVAYLLPAIYFAVRNGEHVVVSTNTINLQDQLYGKDIPDLQQLLPFEVKVALLKGRSNYLCLRRLNSFRNRPDLSTDDVTMLAKVLAWLPTTATGDQSELFLPNAQQRMRWSQINASADKCSAEQCEYRANGRCFFYQARYRAECSHVIIVNHALLLSDIAVENRALPEYRYLVIDEAHHLEENTTRQLTLHLTGELIAELVEELGVRPHQRKAFGLIAEVGVRAKTGIPKSVAAEIETLLERLRGEGEEVLSSSQVFFEALRGYLEEHSEDNENHSPYGQKFRITMAGRMQPSWSSVEVDAENLSITANRLYRSLEQLRSGLNSVLDDRDVAGLEAVVEDVKVQVRRWKDLVSMLVAMVNEPRNNLIYWLETPPGGGAVSMHAAPLHVGELVQEHLLSAKDCVVMTSATLTADNQFDYMQERLGAWDMKTVSVGSPFDYESSTLVWIPTDIPEPRQPYHQKAVEDTLREVSLALEGRTLALFTAYTQLRATARAIIPELEAHEIVVLEQGDGTSRNQLLESFKKTSRAVLLGTRSFWEGIDVTGDALSCVFIMKLPFAVPSDPIIAARSETFEDPFQEYSLPDAILRFRQGFGRLIRNKTDRGVVVILDNRVLNKPYGQAFLDSLPACTVRRGSSANLPEVARRWVNGNS